VERAPQEGDRGRRVGRVDQGARQQRGAALRARRRAAALHARTQILRDQFVDTETFDAALAEWGEAGLVDIIGCVGNFAMLAMLLKTFQVGLKAGDPELFPDVPGFARVSTQGTESPGTRSG
jgi:hypothetical protein